MLDEARKREKLANMALLATLGLTAAQSPKDFLRTGHIEGPGSALMQRFGQKRREAERNLDHGAISQAARNIKDSGARNKTVKQQKKSLKEFMHLSEMRKEDKVKGKGRTPLYKTTTKKRIEPDETGHLKVKRHHKTVLAGPAHMGRFKQGMKDPTQLPGGFGPEYGGRHPHGGGGSGARDGKPGILRGKKKVPGEKKPRNIMKDGPTPEQKVANRRANKKAQDRMYRGRRAFEGFSNWRDDYSPLEVESFDLITNKPLEPTEGIGSKMLDEKCWPGYEKKGMKTMFGKRYPNCVKKKTRKEEVELTERAPLTPPPPVPSSSSSSGKATLSSFGHGRQYGSSSTNSSRPASRPAPRRAPLTPPPPVPREKVDVGTTADNTKPGVVRLKVENDPELDKINKDAQQRTKRNHPGWWKKHGPKGTAWYGQQQFQRDLTQEEVELDEVTRREISLTANEDKKFKSLLDKARQSKKKPDSNYRKEGGPVRTSKVESDYYARKKKFFSKEELELEEAKEAKSCPAGKYWCYDSKKCKTIPTGWYVGRGGYLEKEEETKKKNGNGNGNGDHDSNGGSDGGGSNGGGNGGGGE